MHRGHAARILLSGAAIVLGACGGRILQGDNFQSNANPSGNDSPTPTPTTSSTPTTPTPTPTSTSVPNSGPPSAFAPCGPAVCGGNEECCIGGSPDGNDGDETASLETCVPSGTCNTALRVVCSSTADCFGSGSVCCVTINPTTEYATAGCQTSCGGDGSPAVQLCGSDDDCPNGGQCFVAGTGPNGAGETIKVCGGAR